MGVTLIANVGSRDVQVEGHPSLPKDSRPLGELIWDKWDELKSSVKFPILGKAVRWLVEKHQLLDRIVLFASNQSNALYSQTDTFPFAMVIQQYFAEEFGDWVNAATSIIEVKENPADYDLMMRFYAAELAKLPPDGVCYVEVTGGTPAMSFMLLWQGVEVLKERARPLYILQGKEEPLHLNIAKNLLSHAILGDLRESLAVYQYPAACALLDRHADFLQQFTPAFAAARMAFEHAKHRANFDFARARSAINLSKLPDLPEEEVAFLRGLGAEFDSAHDDQLLREEIFAAEIDFRNEAYRDALSNVASFTEGFLRRLALRRGVKLTADQKKIDPVWIDGELKLKRWLLDEKIEWDRPVTRLLYTKILEFKGQTDPKLKETLQWVEELNRLQDIRNQATHQHGGVARQDVEHGFKGGIEALLRRLRALYERLTDTSVDENIYARLNAYCLRWLGAEA